MKKKVLFSLLGLLTVFGLVYAAGVPTFKNKDASFTDANVAALSAWYNDLEAKKTADTWSEDDLEAMKSWSKFIVAAFKATKDETEESGENSAALIAFQGKVQPVTGKILVEMLPMILSAKTAVYCNTKWGDAKTPGKYVMTPADDGYYLAAKAKVDAGKKTVLEGYETDWGLCKTGQEVAELKLSYVKGNETSANAAKEELAAAIKNLTDEKTAKLKGASYPTDKLLELTKQAWNYVVVSQYASIYFEGSEGVKGATWDEKNGLKNDNPGKADLIDDYAKLQAASDNYPVAAEEGALLAKESKKIYPDVFTSYSAEGLMPKFKAALDAKLLEATDIKNGIDLMTQLGNLETRVKGYDDLVLKLGTYNATTTVGTYNVSEGSDYAELDSLNTLWGKVTNNGVVIAGVSEDTKKDITLHRADIEKYLGIYAAMKAAVDVLKDGGAANDVYGVATTKLNEGINEETAYGKEGANGEYARYLLLNSLVKDTKTTCSYNGINYLTQVIPAAKVTTLLDKAKKEYQKADLEAQAVKLAKEFKEKPAFSYVEDGTAPLTINDALLNAKGKYPVDTKLKNIKSAIKALKALYVDNEKDAANKGKVDPGDKTSLKDLKFTAPKYDDTVFDADDIIGMQPIDMITLGKIEQAKLIDSSEATLNKLLMTATMYTLSIKFADEYKTTYDEIVNATLEAPTTTSGIRDEEGLAQNVAFNKAYQVYAKFGKANKTYEYDGKHVVEGGLDDVAVANWNWDYDSICVKTDADFTNFGEKIQETVKQLVDSLYKASVNIDHFVAVKRNASNWLATYAYGEFSLYKQVYGLDGVPEELTGDVAEAIKNYKFKAYDEAAWNAAAKAVYDELQRVNGYIKADKIKEETKIWSYKLEDGSFAYDLITPYEVDYSFITLGEKLNVAKNELVWVDQKLDAANIALLPANVIVKNKTNKWAANKIELTEGAAANYWTVEGDVIVNTMVYNKEVFQVKSPFYLPFTVSVDDLKKAMGDENIKARKFNAAYVKEGTNELYLNWAVTETLYANMPYQVQNGAKLAKAKNVALTFNNVVLAGRDDVCYPTDGSVESSTVDVTCTLAGVSMPKTIKPMGETDAETHDIRGEYRLQKSTGVWARIPYKKDGLLQDKQKAVIGSVVLEVTSKTGAPVDYVIRNSYDGVEEEATAIEAVSADAKTAEGIYTISGQKVNSMAQPGLYIVNGKKVIKK